MANYYPPKTQNIYRRMLAAAFGLTFAITANAAMAQEDDEPYSPPPSSLSDFVPHYVPTPPSPEENLQRALGTPEIPEPKPFTTSPAYVAPSHQSSDPSSLGGVQGGAQVGGDLYRGRIDTNRNNEIVRGGFDVNRSNGVAFGASAGQSNGKINGAEAHVTVPTDSKKH